MADTPTGHRRALRWPGSVALLFLKRTVRAGLAIGISLVLLAAGSLVTSPAASAGTVQDEQIFIQLINQVRADVGLPALTVDAELTSGARSWAESMAGNDQLAHSPNMAQGVTAQWTVLGENVGVHGVHNLQQLFQAFLDSPSHYKNLVDPRFQHVGVGVAHTDGGKLWTTHRFMATNTPAPPPTTSPPTTAAPTTAVPTTAVPTTAAPVTHAPTTKAPTTAAPTTQAPTTTAQPATTPPTTQPLTTQAPTTAAPLTQAPTTTVPASPSPGAGAPEAGPSAMPGDDEQLDQANMAELVKPDVSTIEEVLIDLAEAGI